MTDQLASILPLPATDASINGAAFVPLAGKVPLVRVTRTMLGAAVVVAAEPLADRVRERLAAEGLSTVAVVSAENPGSRAQCLTAALQSVGARVRHLLIHDIHRPLTPASVRDRVLAGLATGSSVVMPMLPVTDSVKTVDVTGAVTATLDRSTLRAVQYPRGFTVGTLSRMLAARTSEDFDEVGESLRTGAPITVVDGDADAFTVELPRDTAYVEAIIACRRD